MWSPISLSELSSHWPYPFPSSILAFSQALADIAYSQYLTILVQQKLTSVCKSNIHKHVKQISRHTESMTWKPLWKQPSRCYCTDQLNHSLKLNLINWNFKDKLTFNHCKFTLTCHFKFSALKFQGRPFAQFLKLKPL